MNRYRFELILAVVLLAICTLVWHWEAPGRPLTKPEIDRYVSLIDKQVPMPPGEHDDFLARLRVFGANDDGRPVYMLNLMRYFDHLLPGSGLPADFKGTPVEANAHYESGAIPLALSSGTTPPMMGNVREPNVTPSARDEDLWNRILVIRYPNRRAFFELLSAPGYAKLAPYKLGALHVALVPIESELVTPDLTLMTLLASLIVFLGAGWFRAAHRH